MSVTASLIARRAIEATRAAPHAANPAAEREREARLILLAQIERQWVDLDYVVTIANRLNAMLGDDAVPYENGERPTEYLYRVSLAIEKRLET